MLVSIVAARVLKAVASMMRWSMREEEDCDSFHGRKYGDEDAGDADATVVTVIITAASIMNNCDIITDIMTFI